MVPPDRLLALRTSGTLLIRSRGSSRSWQLQHKHQTSDLWRDSRSMELPVGNVSCASEVRGLVHRPLGTKIFHGLSARVYVEVFKDTSRA